MRKSIAAYWGKLWKAATAGDARKLPTTQCDRMWRAFHAVCFSHDFVVDCELFLYPALLQNATCRLFNQSSVTRLFENIILFKTTVVPTTVAGSQSEEIEMTVVEENTLRYAVGFVPFSLKKQCSKRKTGTDDGLKTRTFGEKIKCLSALGVDDELEKSQTFLEYTRSWIEKQNGHPGQGTLHLYSLQVLQMCVKLWVNIRGHAFAANWVEKFKQSQCAGKNKTLKELS
ncbi:Hypothetical predicted protein [Paramuricea clavata]|uniref:Uncharacterized protein n=1 Tax=Paramuricea clavata TaxID=317549 RepID=A0A6S7I006_PARCT|nr:Hypothetical predicted protein [Paramuricea clavata]